MNRKRKLQIISLILVISMIFVATSVWAIDENVDSVYYYIWFPEDLFQDEAFVMAMQEQLIAEYGEIFLNNLGTARANADRVNALFPRSRSDSRYIYEVVYPDFFGGMYINNDGILVVNIVNSASRGLGSVLEYVSFRNVVATNDIIIKHVNFSYNEIHNTKAALVDFFSTQDSAIRDNNNIVAIATDEKYNSVVVYLEIYNEEEIALFENTIFDSPIIIFRESGGPTEIGLRPQHEQLNDTDFTEENLNMDEINTNMSTFNPGDHIPAMGGSIGYRALRWAGGIQHGFVTAGHVTSPGANIPGIGAVSSWQFSGPLDAAFVVTNAGVNVTNNLTAWRAGWWIENHTLCTQVLQTFVQGDIMGTIYNFGHPIFESGAIKHTNITSVARPHITGLVQTYATMTFGGTSGAIVFQVLHPSWFWQTAGIHLGRTGGFQIFNRADIINAAFGLSRW